MDYARNARTGNPSIAGKRRLAPSADKVGAPHNAARKTTASRDRSARRVTRTVQESPEVDLPTLRHSSAARRRLLGLANTDHPVHCCSAAAHWGCRVDSFAQTLAWWRRRVRTRLIGSFQLSIAPVQYWSRIIFACLFSQATAKT